MATVLEGVVVNSVDEDGRFTRLCSNPVKVEVIDTASETSVMLFDGEERRALPPFHFPNPGRVSLPLSSRFPLLSPLRSRPP